MTIYLAARYSRRLELVAYRTQLQEAGHEVTSRWLNGEHESLDADWTQIPREQVAEWAEQDLEDIDEADVVIVFTEAQPVGRRRGGYHVETGFALAQEKLLAIVGPRENTFHCLDEVEVFQIFEECLAWLEEIEEDTTELEDES